MACSSGCKTQDHASWGECVRAKRYLTCYPEAKAYHKFNDGEVQHFRDAAEQGILPDTTRRKDVDRAIKISESTGKPYRADADPLGNWTDA